jgi:hypothetical protein
MPQIAVGDGIIGVRCFPAGNELLREAARSRSIAARAGVNMQKVCHATVSSVKVIITRTSTAENFFSGVGIAALGYILKVTTLV